MTFYTDQSLIRDTICIKSIKERKQKCIKMYFFFKVSWFNKWIKCTTEKASIYSFSHKNVERKCDSCCSADPSPVECSHTGLFIEKVATPPKSCNKNDLQTKGSECFGEPDPQFKSNECS